MLRNNWPIRIYNQINNKLSGHALNAWREAGMRGYKALDQDMRAIRGNGMQFEMDRLYSIRGNVVPCYNGFHFCKAIEYLNVYYNVKNSRIFEIEADGEIIEYDENKYAAEKIRLVRELTKEEIWDYFSRNQGRLIKSRDSYIRMAVAEQGCGLDTLLYDEDYIVREAVAGQGYGLDVLVHDENWFVREAVAKKGYGLGILVHDENLLVRVAVVKQGYGLDVLLYDKDPFVRKKVAEQGYGLDILAYDEDYNVRTTAKMITRYSGNVHIVQ